MEIKASIEALAYVARFAGREKTRDYICGVHVERSKAGGVLLVATDGHRLAVWHDEAGAIDGEGSATIRTTGYEGQIMLRVARASPSGAAFTYRDGVVEIGAFSFAGRAIDRDFVDWRRVIPDAAFGPASCVPSFNPEYLAGFAYGRRAIWVTGTKPSGPAIVRVSGLPHILGVLMPMSGDFPIGKPDWLNG